MFSLGYRMIIQKLCSSDLWVAGIKAPLWHIKRIASGTHHVSEQVRLPLHTTKGCQNTVHNMVLQDIVESIRFLAAPSYQLYPEISTPSADSP